VEITADAFRRFVFEKPGVLEGIASAVVERRAAIEKSRAEAVAASVPAGERGQLPRACQAVPQIPA
jgi:hypothetical protein